MNRVPLLLASFLAVSACRTTLQESSDHRNRAARPSVAPDAIFLERLLDISNHSSQVLQSIDTVLIASPEDLQNLRIRLGVSDSSAVVMNPLDLLRRLISEIGVAHAIVWHGETAWRWESLGGKRVLGMPVQLIVIEREQQLSYAIVVNDEGVDKSFAIARQPNDAKDSLELDLEQLTTLYQQLASQKIKFPTFALQGQFKLLSNDKTFTIEAKGFGWSSSRIQFTAESFNLSFSRTDNSLQGFSLSGVMRNSAATTPPRSLRIEATQTTDQGWELQFSEN